MLYTDGLHSVVSYYNLFTTDVHSQRDEELSFGPPYVIEVISSSVLSMCVNPGRGHSH